MINSLDDLRAIYPEPKARAVKKQLAHLDPHCMKFISLSPFLVVASASGGGDLDASPRGGAPGFVKAPDPTTLLLPDGKGNNRLDTLTNIIATGRVGLLFLIPGVDETLRVNGDAQLRDESTLLEMFADLQNPPKVVIRIKVREVYLHCAKAFMRSKLWSVESQVERSVLPTLGKMICDQIGLLEPVETQEQMLARYRADL